MDNGKQKKYLGFMSLITSIGLAILCTSDASAQSPVVQSTLPPSTQTKQSYLQQASEEAAERKQQATAELDETAKAKEASAVKQKAPEAQQDSLEFFNRSMFQFNDLVDCYIAKPVAIIYNLIIPRPLNQGIHNFFLNIETIPTIANDILQLNLYQTLNDAWRLVINTTIGIGGLFDVASRLGLPYYKNDFGLTLAFWGYEDSTYIVLPFWGPRTVRDGIIGLPVDYYAFSIYPYIRPYRARYGLYALSVVDARAQLLQFQPVIEEVAVDKYVFMRNAYLQRRAFQIKEAKIWGPKHIIESPVASVD
jgi:phospholipid-binding lipoprotein MlaA